MRWQSARAIEWAARVVYRTQIDDTAVVRTLKVSIEMKFSIPNSIISKSWLSNVRPWVGDGWNACEAKRAREGKGRDVRKGCREGVVAKRTEQRTEWSKVERVRRDGAGTRDKERED